MSTILIIEDDEHQRFYLTSLLKKIGHDVVEADEGDLGIQKYQQNPIDLVMTDIFMPGKEGLATIMDLKRISPQVKIIAMSAGASSMNNVLDTAKDFGADIIMEKPIEIDSLKDSLKKLLTDS
jgi:DNA-binding response OmpR family regulator